MLPLTAPRHPPPHPDNDVDKIITFSGVVHGRALDDTVYVYVYDITIECKINIRLKGRKKL